MVFYEGFMGTEMFTQCNFDLTQTAFKFTYSLTNNSPQFSYFYVTCKCKPKINLC